jgi:hypothetical protein
MNKALILAAPLVMLAACAAPAGNVNGGSAKVAAASSTGAQYCKKDRLTANASELTCTWSPSASEACENVNLSTLTRASVASEPANAGRCGNGQWLVSVTPR